MYKHKSVCEYILEICSLGITNVSVDRTHVSFGITEN